MDDQTKQTIIHNIINGFKRVYWITFSIMGTIALAGIINLILYGVLNIDDDTKTALLIAGSVLLGIGGSFNLLWLCFYFCMKKQQNSIVNTLQSRNGLITEWIYTFDSDFQGYLKSEYGFAGQKIKRASGFIIFLAIVGVVAWSKLIIIVNILSGYLFRSL
jgi:hypothetical protein